MQKAELEAEEKRLKKTRAALLTVQSKLENLLEKLSKSGPTTANLQEKIETCEIEIASLETQEKEIKNRMKNQTKKVAEPIENDSIENLIKIGQKGIDF